MDSNLQRNQVNLKETKFVDQEHPSIWLQLMDNADCLGVVISADMGPTEQYISFYFDNKDLDRLEGLIRSIREHRGW